MLAVFKLHNRPSVLKRKLCELPKKVFPYFPLSSSTFCTLFWAILMTASKDFWSRK